MEHTRDADNWPYLKAKEWAEIVWRERRINDPLRWNVLHQNPNGTYVAYSSKRLTYPEFSSIVLLRRKLGLTWGRYNSRVRGNDTLKQKELFKNATR